MYSRFMHSVSCWGQEITITSAAQQSKQNAIKWIFEKKKDRHDTSTHERYCLSVCILTYEPLTVVVITGLR